MRVNKFFLLILFLMGHHLFFGQEFNSFKWKNRILLIEAKEINDQNLLEQLQLLKKKSDELNERKLLIFRRLPNQISQLNVDTFQPEIGTVERMDSAQPDQFTLTLIGLDGTVKLSSKTPVKPQKLFDLIDSMPMRQAELRKKN